MRDDSHVITCVNEAKMVLCLIKVAVVDAAASDLRWIGKLFQNVGAAKMKARREMLVGAKPLSGIYCKSVPNDVGLGERTKG